jgi:hypothetical protein
MRKTAVVTGGKPIAVPLQPISGVSAINPLVAFYDIITEHLVHDLSYQAYMNSSSDNTF